MTPKVSVVIPSYNRAQKTQKAIESVLSQTFTDFEVIVVDDGSADNTGEALANAFGNRIRYYYQENQGASVARNRGIKEARGEWIAFLDSDDRWEKEKLEWQLKALAEFSPSCGGCYTDVRFFNHPETRTMFELAESNYRHDGEIGVNTDVLRLLVRPGGAGMVVCLSSFIVHRDLVQGADGFNPSLLYSQDSDFMFRMAMATKFCFVNRPLVQFDRAPVEDRHVGVSSEWNKQDFFLRDSQIRLEGLSQLTRNQPAAIRNLIRRQLGSVHSGWVNFYLGAGEHGKARSAAFQAVRMNPNPKLVLKWLLSWISPGMALRAYQLRERKKASSFTV